ncbi:MAG: hypothetical protein U0174_24895 [Polyangiaceae bacterium]
MTENVDKLLDQVCAYEGAISGPCADILAQRVPHGAALLTNMVAWYPFSEEPRNFFEQVVRHLRGIAKPSPDCIGAEYWMREQAADSDFPFHFDRDEALQSTVVSPDLSSILYLSDVGGTTLIVGLTPTSEGVPRRGSAVAPKVARYATFSGRLFHGVQGADPSPLKRRAFFVNWWTHKPGGASDPSEAFIQSCPLVEGLEWPDPKSVLNDPTVPIDFSPDGLMPDEEWEAFMKNRATANLLVDP